jgi:hypothetical protein
MINQTKMSFYASANTNRDRHQKYNHPKGAPDVDLIFGSAGSVNVGFNNPNKRVQQVTVPSSSPGSATDSVLTRAASDMNKNFPNISSGGGGTR